MPQPHRTTRDSSTAASASDVGQAPLKTRRSGSLMTCSIVCCWSWDAAQHTFFGSPQQHVMCTCYSLVLCTSNLNSVLLYGLGSEERDSLKSARQGT